MLSLSCPGSYKGPSNVSLRYDRDVSTATFPINLHFALLFLLIYNGVRMLLSRGVLMCCDARRMFVGCVHVGVSGCAGIH